MKKEKRGLFISVEGLNLILREEVVDMLEKEYLKDDNKTILITREPGNVETAKMISEVAEKEVSGKTKLFLKLSERREHLVKNILPSLKKFDYVVIDSYCHFTFAHDGYGEEGNIQDIYTLNSYMTENIFPDITFVLDAPCFISKKELLNEQEKVHLRLKKEYDERVREGYREMSEDSKYGHMVIIDGDLAKEKIVSDMINYIGTVELAKSLKMMARMKFNDNIDDALKNLPNGKIIDISNGLKKRD